MNKKFSDWLKLDLHIHTDLSRTTKEDDYKGDFDIDNLKIKLEDNDVKIFSLTDNNIINVEAYENYYFNYDPKHDPLLLLGIELDIAVVKRKERIYHTLLIFDIDDIERVKDISERLEQKYVTLGIGNKKKRKLTFDDIVELFPKEHYFFIPHAYSDKNIVTAHKDGTVIEAQKMVLLMQCALEKVTKPETIAAYEFGFNTLLSSNFKSKKDIPYINFSDNHCVEKYPCRHKGENNIGNHEFYFIKGSKCYESIRLAFVDPESRIKTTNEFNEINHTNNTIDLLQINDCGIIEDVELNFSPHLNVIIGGRSSGKSLLLWAIGKKLDVLNLDNKYSKVNLETIKIKANRDSDLKECISLQQEFLYIKQGDIINYFESGELKDLANKSNRNIDYDNALVEFKKHKTKLEEKQISFINAYKAVYDLGSSKKYILHNSVIDSALSNFCILKFDKEYIVQTIDKSKIIDEAYTILTRIRQDISTVSKIQLLKFNAEESSLLDKTSELINNKAELIIKLRTLNQTKLSFINKVDKIIANVNNGLNLEARQKDLSNQSIANLKRDIQSNFEVLKNLKKASDLFEKFESNFYQEFNVNTGISLVLETPKKYNIKDEILEGLNKSKTDFSIYLNSFLLLLNYCSIKNLGGNAPENLNKKINTQLNSCYNGISSPKDYLKYSDGETSKEKSPGYNSEKYLEIILNNPSSKTIFIDQPEDNLGNRFIAEGLVEILRRIKFKKQIFLVTHNPSIVVYGDAESIIIAKNDENKISYKQIVLENKDAQKEICNILDGGEYIFNNRAKKYNIQRILKNA